MGLSPLRPLGTAPVPMVPGRDVFGTPGWLTTLVLRRGDGVGVTIVADGICPWRCTRPLRWRACAAFEITLRDMARMIKMRTSDDMEGSSGFRTMSRIHNAIDIGIASTGWQIGFMNFY
ncbi:MAG: hypothetical protein BGN91_03685 [Nitrobacter sp. 62-13]|nr:MAG: hypothetical protein BGN91_03685 [Nitrobacter sp. 62-13]